MKITQGDIVLVPFPFTDLSSVKTRPALVVSNDSLRGDDVILCGITSKKAGFQELELTNNSLVKGRLPLKSYVRIGKVVSLDKKIVRQVVARVKPVHLQAIVRAISGFLKI